ncbi:MAG: CDP-diacylglycerol--serine O-phosphatidyltransferase, partial [Sporomusaceae bacterium]|nr:CDP-diacylglycerol--serine O-phosphatidyltransferase [Sporomusaceae bacterium]
RFNVNTTTVKGYFMGLPIPAGGCVVATFIMTGIQPSGYWFLGFVAIFGYLMVSTVRYPDFKGKGEKIYRIAIILAVATGGYLFYALPHSYLFAPFFTYAVFGIFNSILRLLDYKSALS